MTESTTPAAPISSDPEGASPAPAPQARASEAAKYRVQLRETEGQRDALAARLETMQRAEVERIAGSRIAKGEALWAAGVELADLLDDDGNVDPLKVPTVADAAAEKLGLTRPQRGPVIPTQGDTPDVSAIRGDFASAFGPQQ